MSKSSNGLSIIIPSYNESQNITKTIEQFFNTLKDTNIQFEVIIVNDGSSDNTSNVLSELESKNYKNEIRFKVITNPMNMGYGFSLKRGIRNSKFGNICICDADSTYPIHETKNLFDIYIQKDLDMLVTRRTGPYLNSSLLKAIMRKFFVLITEFSTGRRVPDVNSGFRFFKKYEAQKYLDILSAGFSFTTSLTIIFLHKHLFVEFVPIDYYKRAGKSKVKHIRDAMRALQIISQCILVSNPIKLYIITALIYSSIIFIGLPLLLLSKNIFLIYTFFISINFIIFSISHLSVQNMLFNKIETTQNNLNKEC